MMDRRKFIPLLGALVVMSAQAQDVPQVTANQCRPTCRTTSGATG